MTTIERIASWAAGLRLTDVPDRVVSLLRAQQLSVFGALGASAGDDATRRVLAGLGVGSAPLTSDRAENAIYAGAAMSVALDYDDYLCFGHTGHSSVLVPALFGGGNRESMRLEAQLAANEIGGRLGGACLIGPLNGQMWSFIHAAAAAVAGGLMLGLEERQLAHALAIALYEPPRPSVPGFMAPDSKLLTAAEPIVMGLRAARLAAAGVTGPLDVLDHPKGFFSAFSYAPMRGMLESLGRGWATETLSVKPYPGCAYVDSVVDALMELGPPKAEEIHRIHVTAGVLTCGMDAMSAEYVSEESLSPVSVNFSVSVNAAITVVGGDLDAETLRASWIEQHRNEIRTVMSRVRLEHDWELTRRGSGAFTSLIPLRSVVADVGRRRLLGGFARMRREHGTIALGIRDAPEVVRWLRTAGSSTEPKEGFWSEEATRAFCMNLPAKVTIELTHGGEIETTVDIPRGAAGHAEFGPLEAARSKFERWAPELWGDDATDLAQAIERDAEGIRGLLRKARLPR